jgi:hypothetical protein
MPQDATHLRTLRDRARRARRRGPARERGVTGVLSMMFLVMFASLAAAMAVVSQGNLQTAHTQMRVNQALSATDTGLEIAAARLAEASRQFRIEKGEVTPDYALQLWNGTYVQTDGAVLDPDGDTRSDGLIDVLADMHASDVTTSITTDYTPLSDWLATNPIVLETAGPDPAVAVGITYIPLPSEGAVRVVSTGYALDFASERWVRRTAQQDFRIFKRVDHAILGPAKIMIGKNVQVNGPLGARFTGVNFVNGDPLVMESDFEGLDNTLDDKIADFRDAVIADDTDGDGRLRTAHVIEARSLGTLNSNDYDNDAAPDGAFADADNNGAIDEFDIFLTHYGGGDGRVVLGPEFTAGTPYDGQPAEFDDIDDELAELLDYAMPDRNGDGVVDALDTKLGYADGVIDHRDRYAKVRGPVTFKVDRHAWESSIDEAGSILGDYQKKIAGTIDPDDEEAPVQFNADEDALPSVDASTFDTAQSDLAARADGASFATQAGLGGPPFQLALDSNGVVIDQVFNPAIETVIEGTPFGSPAAADFYRRPVFRDKTFKNVVIPRGLNALFINCTFVGVTRVASYANNSHPAWQFYGKQESDLSLVYPPPPATSDAQLDNDYFTAAIIKPSDFDVPRHVVDGLPYVNTKPLSNNVRFHDCTFVGSVVADKPGNYTHIRNKLQFTGATQFFKEHPVEPENPALNPDEDDKAEIDKSSMLAPHYSVDIGTNNAPREQDVNLEGLVIAGVLDVRGNTTINGALLLTFEPSLDDPALQHFGEPVGNPADFNITLGYFGPDDGDQEGINVADLETGPGGVPILGYDVNGDGIPDPGATAADGVPITFNGFGRVVLNWDPDLIMPDGVIAPVTVEAVPITYREGRVIVEDYQ